MREAIMAGIEAWRLRHPKASLQEMAAAVDEGLAERRTRLWQDVVLASRATDVSQARGPDWPVCPRAGRQWSALSRSP